MMNQKFIQLYLFFGCLFFFQQMVFGEVIERVIAVVNDKPVYLSDVRKRALPTLRRVALSGASGENLKPPPEFYERLAQQLIDEKLVEQEALELKVSVTADDVEKMLENLRQQNGLDKKEFEQALKAQGYDPAQHRRDMKKQLLRLKVLNTQVRSKVRITENDVRKEYEKRVGKSNLKFRFQVSHIFFPIEEGASATVVSELKKKGQSLLPNVTTENFSDMAERLGGGDLGWLNQGDLHSSLESVLITMNSGEVSSLIRGPTGFHILLLKNKERGGDGLDSYDEMKGNIYREMLDKAMSRQEEIWLEEVRRKAVISRTFHFD